MEPSQEASELRKIVQRGNTIASDQEELIKNLKEQVRRLNTSVDYAKGYLELLKEDRTLTKSEGAIVEMVLNYLRQWKL